MTLLCRDIGKCLLMARLGHLGSLKLNESQTGTKWKLKLIENENVTWKKTF